MPHGLTLPLALDRHLSLSLDCQELQTFTHKANRIATPSPPWESQLLLLDSVPQEVRLPCFCQDQPVLGTSSRLASRWSTQLSCGRAGTGSAQTASGWQATRVLLSPPGPLRCAAPGGTPARDLAVSRAPCLCRAAALLSVLRLIQFGTCLLSSLSLKGFLHPAQGQ